MRAHERRNKSPILLAKLRTQLAMAIPVSAHSHEVVSVSFRLLREIRLQWLGKAGLKRKCQRHSDSNKEPLRKNREEEDGLLFHVVALDQWSRRAAGEGPYYYNFLIIRCRERFL